MLCETTHPPAPDALRERFLQGMRGLAGGVCIIATEHAGTRYGLTVTSVCSLSLAPPSMLLCIDRRSEAHDPLCSAGLLSINVLSATQRRTARLFGGLEPGRGPLRFEDGAWSRSPAGLPRLAGCLCNLECAITSIADGRTHSILICAVQSVDVAAGAPLVYWERDFHTLRSVPHPAP